MICLSFKQGKSHSFSLCPPLFLASSRWKAKVTLFCQSARPANFACHLSQDMILKQFQPRHTEQLFVLNLPWTLVSWNPFLLYNQSNDCLFEWAVLITHLTTRCRKLIILPFVCHLLQRCNPVVDWNHSHRSSRRLFQECVCVRERERYYDVLWCVIMCGGDVPWDFCP